MTKSCVSFLSMPHPHKMSDINFGRQGRNVCIGFCKKVSVCKLQRGEYLMRTNDFGKNPLPARAMEEDTSPFARAPKKCHLTPSRPPHNPPTPTVPLTSKWTDTRGRLAGNPGVILSFPRNRVSLTAGRCEYRVHHALVRIRASTVYARESHTTTT